LIGNQFIITSSPFHLFTSSSPMRLDIFLKQSRIVPRRALAQQLCEAGAVSVNNAQAKSAREVRTGDTITIRQRGRITTVRVVEVPVKPPTKAQASSLYETVSVKATDPID
jgi:ribosomal 50S subunit-recycling heat shock protein